MRHGAVILVVIVGVCFVAGMLKVAALAAIVAFGIEAVFMLARR